MNLVKKLKKSLINMPGWRTDRKIIVFESDDWGSIRMRSKNDYSYFIDKGYRVDLCTYNRYDSLESNKDLSLLFNLLTKYKDYYGRAPIITFNNIVANPDFKKIRESDFKNYFYEPFTETLKNYPDRDKVYSLYLQGLSEKLIKIQLHGREHVNFKRWLKALQNGQKDILEAFSRHMFTVQYGLNTSGRNNFLDSFGSSNANDLVEFRKTLSSGMKLFFGLWGETSKSFIAPTYVWPTELDKILLQLNIKYIQGTHVQRVPESVHDLGIKRKYHYMGQKNNLNQIYLVRNSFFEPSSKFDYDWINSCLNDIDIAFQWKKPAIVSMHRVNFIGGIEIANRDKNLRLFETLLDKILKKYPEVEFMSTDQLGDLIVKS